MGRRTGFSPSTYAAACLTCHGVGTLRKPNPAKLIVDPTKPLCGGAMHSPGFFPKGYLGKPYNGGYDMVQALAARYKFDPFQTPWNAMTPEAQQAFLFGDPVLIVQDLDFSYIPGSPVLNARGYAARAPAETPPAAVRRPRSSQTIEKRACFFPGQAPYPDPRPVPEAPCLAVPSTVCVAASASVVR